jgi:Tetracyclin repressor-like, C-terminal domain
MPLELARTSCFVRLIAIENLHQGQSLAQMENMKTLNANILKSLGGILGHGHAVGIFRRPTGALDVHLMISGLCFHRVSNRYSFGTVVDCDLSAPDIRSRHRLVVVDAVVGYLKQP